MDRLKSLLKRLTPDHFVPTTAVFPDIDTEAIARDLDLAKKGTARGEQNLPPATAKSRDSIEQEIVDKVSDLRHKALIRYEEHLQTYKSRLFQTAQASKAELVKITGDSRNKFHAAREECENNLINESQRVIEHENELNRFRKVNRIERPVYEPWPITDSIGFAAIMVILESALNGYFFAKGNEYGLVGGVSVAGIVSILNVGVSLILGYFSRYINHISDVQTFCGFVSVLFFLAFAVGFNFAVAHFRDAANILAWDQAAVEALATLKATPLALVSIESWLLIGIGIFICGISFWKGYLLDDPYPGYGRVYRNLEKERDEYTKLARETRDKFLNLKEDATKDLQRARMDISSVMNEAILVLFAKHGLSGKREAFLEHANRSVNRLLSVYRNKNIDARKSKPPKHFSQVFAFDSIKLPPPGGIDQTSAEKKLAEMTAIIEKTIGKITSDCEKAINSLPTIPELNKQKS